MTRTGITVLEGNDFLVADERGDVDGGMTGLFSDDVRHVSRWVLTVDRERPALLASDTLNHFSAAAYGALERGGASGAPPLATVRRVFVSSGIFQESLDVLNSGLVPASITVRYEFDCDFLDLFEVKAGVMGDLPFAADLEPLTSSRSYDGNENVFRFAVAGQGFDAATLIWFSRHGRPGERSVQFEVELAPHSSWNVQAHVVMLSGEPRLPTYSSERFGASRRRAEVELEAWHEHAPRLTADDHGLEQVYRRSVADLGALRMRPDQGASHGELPAAGLPWFMTVFGRDVSIASLQTMMLGQDLAKAALRTLARLQATADEPERDAEPGKILHEMRFGRIAALTDWFPYYGSIDSTPLFLMLLHETWRWSRDDAFVRELEAPARAALAWIEQHGDLDGDGYLEYRRRSQNGLVTQCWKDSPGAIQFADGSVAQGAIAPCEAQGYAYAARLGLAEVAEASWGDAALAARLRADAAALRERFNRDFWIERDGEGWFALALDGEKRPVDTLTSNIGHLLWTGIADEPRAAATAASLMSPTLFSGWGIRTLAVRERGYNPIEYHTGTVWPHDTSIAAAGLARAGDRVGAARLLRALAEAAAHVGWRLPEVLAGFSRVDTSFPVEYPTTCSPQAWAACAPILALQAATGLAPAADGSRLVVEDEVDLGCRRLELVGIRALGRRHALRVEDGRASVEPLD